MSHELHPIMVKALAPYPQCNGAEGCDTCEHQEED